MDRSAGDVDLFFLKHLLDPDVSCSGVSANAHGRIVVRQALTLDRDRCHDTCWQ